MITSIVLIFASICAIITSINLEIKVQKIYQQFLYNYII